MVWKVDLGICVIILLSFGMNTLQECGKSIGQYTVLCVLHPDVQVVEPFNFTLCTHGVFSTSVECFEDEEKCKVSELEELEGAIHWTFPHLPQDLGILLNIRDMKEFLFGEGGSKLRRSNTINELVKFVEDNFLTFVMTSGAASGIGSSEKERSIYFQFLQELAEELHDRNFYLGQELGQRSNNVVVNMNVTEVSRFVDWFTIAPYQMRFDGSLQPLTPLTTYRGQSEGTTRYWIEKVLQLVRPECLIIDIGPLLHKQRSVETAIEPGPGSIDNGSGSDGFDISTICYNLQRLANDCREIWDAESATPWAVCGNDYYSYENPRSLRLKTDLLLQYNITRVMFWTDDITPTNVCNNGDPFGLLRAVQGIRRTL